MTELGPEARAILEAARRAERPAPGDAARLRAAILARVAAPAAPGVPDTSGGSGGSGHGSLAGPPQHTVHAASGGSAAGTSATSAAGTSAGTAAGTTAGTTVGTAVGTAAGTAVGLGLTGKIVLVIMGIGLVAGGGLWSARSGPGDRPDDRRAGQGEIGLVAGPTASAPSGSEARAGVSGAASDIQPDAAPDMALAGPEQPAVARTGPPSSPDEERGSHAADRRRRARAETRSSPESLHQELMLIERAKAALDADGAGSALAALAKHRSRFRAGVLAAEREWLRIRALCALGRERQAAAVARRFRRTWPRSPYADRLADTCAGSAGPASGRDSGISGSTVE